MFRNFTKYEVFEDGRIWSYPHKKWLKPQTRKDGYQQVRLSDNEGKMKTYLVHRIVYESVTGEPIPKGMQVSHINEDKTDSRFFENLNLLSRKENINWGSGIERSVKARINGKRSKAVGAFQNEKLVMTFPSTMEADRNGFTQGCVSAYLREGNNIYKGYEWRYL